MPAPTTLPSWSALTDHAVSMRSVHLRDLFQQDPNRFDRFTIEENELLLDLSKNRITEETFRHLIQLAREIELENWRERMFKGERINVTEDRPVLHVALRNRSNRPILVAGEDVMPAVNGVAQPHAQLLRTGASWGMARLRRSVHHRHRQHWHWGLRPGPPNGYGSVETLWPG